MKLNIGKERMKDSSYSLQSRDEVKNRKGMLSLPHISPLVKYRFEAKRKSGIELPFPQLDPFDGGIHAHILLLLATPGRQANGTGFVSQNNPDPTAKRIFDICQEEEIPRHVTILWNIVPWYLGNERKTNNPTAQDIRTGKSLLPGLVGVLPEMKSIVLMGSIAQKASDVLKDIGCKVFYCPHSGNRTRISNPNFETEIRNTFKEAYNHSRREIRGHDTQSNKI